MKLKPAASELQLAEIGVAAAAAHEEGYPLYVVTLLAVQLRAWGPIMSAIEAEGFTLDKFAIAPEGHAVAVFRRQT